MCIIIIIIIMSLSSGRTKFNVKTAILQFKHYANIQAE